MASAVLDSSALLALLFDEPGASEVRRALRGSLMSTVNLAEVVSKLLDRGVPAELGRKAVDRLPVKIEPFDAETALDAGLLREATRHIGLSLADRACLSLAKRLNLPAMTADRIWAGASLGVEVHLIR